MADDSVPQLMFVSQLMEMGFAKNRAEKAILITGNNSVERAMDWLFEHQGDQDIDEPYVPPKGHVLGVGVSGESSGEIENKETDGDSPMPETEDPTATSPPLVAKSLVCQDCNKVLRNESEVEVHAARTGHANFVESTEEKKPLTEAERAQQLAKLQEKIKEKRLEKEIKDKSLNIEREKERRRTGQELAQAKNKREYEEALKLANEKKREKIEERLARQRVKEQIEKDKLDRAEKFGKTTPSSDSGSQPVETPPASIPPQPKREYKETRLQIRLPNGTALTQTFNVDERLSAVRLYVTVNRKDSMNDDNFGLMTPFPRTTFTHEHYDSTLSELGLVPSAVLTVTKSQNH